MGAAPEIRFGTSGWRGAWGREVDPARLRRLTRAIAHWLAEGDRGRRVLVGFDGRSASRALAELASDVLLAEGLQPELALEVGPTPAVTHALAQGRHAAGLMLTASHNPARDHGLKLFTADGATVDDAAARRIEALVSRVHGVAAVGVRPRAVARCDLRGPYLAALAAQVERASFARAPIRVVYDAMHGAAGGWFDVLLRSLGVDVMGLRVEPDAHFGGGQPDPVRSRIGPLIARMRRCSGLVLGIANDGDGDRVGVVDGRRRVLSETQVLALLVDHLAETGRIARGVAIGVATGSLVEKVARARGLAVERHPVGFKHLSRALLAGRVDVAGEESGGFALAAMGPDKDGLLAGLLLVELVAQTRRPLEDRLDRLEARFGTSACGRIALADGARFGAALERLAERPPRRVDGASVVGCDGRSGLRLALADGGFVMFRHSGTEAVVRVYAEAADPRQLERRLRAGVDLLVENRQRSRR